MWNSTEAVVATTGVDEHEARDDWRNTYLCTGFKICKMIEVLKKFYDGSLAKDDWRNTYSW
jgi:hypothetical protein